MGSNCFKSAENNNTCDNQPEQPLVQPKRVHWEITEVGIERRNSPYRQRYQETVQNRLQQKALAEEAAKKRLDQNKFKRQITKNVAKERKKWRQRQSNSSSLDDGVYRSTTYDDHFYD